MSVPRVDKPGTCAECGRDTNQVGSTLMVRECRDCSKLVCGVCRDTHRCVESQIHYDQIPGERPREARVGENGNGKALSMCGAAMVAASTALVIAIVTSLTLVIHVSQSSHTGTVERLRAIERELTQLREDDARLREELRTLRSERGVPR